MRPTYSVRQSTERLFVRTNGVTRERLCLIDHDRLLVLISVAVPKDMLYTVQASVTGRLSASQYTPSNCGLALLPVFGNMTLPLGWRFISGCYLVRAA